MMRQGWSIGLVVFLFFVGCAKEKEKVSGWAAFPVAIYTDPAIVASPDQYDDFLQAMSFWEASAGRKLFDYRGNWSGGAAFTGAVEKPSQINANVLFFQNPWPFEANTAGMTISISSDEGTQGSIVMINSRIQTCTGDCHGDFSRISQQKLLAHELGHFIGLSHSSELGDIMYPSLAPGGSLGGTKINQAALSQAVN